MYLLSNQQVTDELFDEIAMKVFNEDDQIDEGKESRSKQLQILQYSIQCLGLTSSGP